MLREKKSEYWDWFFNILYIRFRSSYQESFTNRSLAVYQFGMPKPVLGGPPIRTDRTLFHEHVPEIGKGYVTVIVLIQKPEAVHQRRIIQRVKLLDAIPSPGAMIVTHCKQEMSIIHSSHPRHSEHHHLQDKPATSPSSWETKIWYISAANSSSVRSTAESPFLVVRHGYVIN